MATIRRHDYWTRVEAILAVLKPIHLHQHASKADGAGISLVVNRWLQIQAKWKDLRTSERYPDLPWDTIEELWEKRYDKQTLPIHHIADALRPETTGPQSRLPGQVFDMIKKDFRRFFPDDESHEEAIAELYAFRMRNSSHPLYQPNSVIYGNTFKPRNAWGCIAMQGSHLAPVARKILSVQANSVASERSFSTINYIHSKARSRLTTDEADMQAFIFMNERVFARLEDSSLARKRRWEDLEEEDWVDLEDAYMYYFSSDPQHYLHTTTELVANPEYQWNGVLQATGNILALGTEVAESV